ncbi:hypothetical protein H112_02792 [Trichophyton rubrum D6]|uniref:Uncharacterized protein n=3 Tax=Trichophyton TaxID=5550 RepID=F2SSH4_TRIRC|nr:uncharacterized protein TERG_05428 [Trichophyton rubrum CBS 118892]EZF24687.1 hypothetical protein H100_02799 [Trichophyton rubrum MR850]EZF43753.1 hypothetical protein H102_02791 [Trichophyton rubrum CBS 100081]EZF54346.1 hypothetical protein H103_02803 [Trichophyton rubrum CBS 288.86]EZF65037.1 hypothetical protein H104_02782 [Trichophyton rubrum CBS 289.86]EZF75614.1 hypothetical protein H105_02808 [Trichophyton soudanense CBS 452.61]EZF86244.1 hypothetical protein H110_02801 [Trichophy
MESERIHDHDTQDADATDTLTQLHSSFVPELSSNITNSEVSTKSRFLNEQGVDNETRDLYTNLYGRSGDDGALFANVNNVLPSGIQPGDLSTGHVANHSNSSDGPTMILIPRESDNLTISLHALQDTSSSRQKARISLNARPAVNPIIMDGVNSIIPKDRWSDWSS